MKYFIFTIVIDNKPSRKVKVQSQSFPPSLPNTTENIVFKRTSDVRKIFSTKIIKIKWDEILYFAEWNQNDKI